MCHENDNQLTLDQIGSMENEELLYEYNYLRESVLSNAQEVATFGYVEAEVDLRGLRRHGLS